MLNGFTKDVINLLYLLGGVVRPGIEAFLSEDDVKDGVRAAACLVHVGGCHSPVQSTHFYQIVWHAVCLPHNYLPNKEDLVMYVQNDQSLILIQKIHDKYKTFKYY